MLTLYYIAFSWILNFYSLILTLEFYPLNQRVICAT
jgi:hypothetical protein